MADDRKKRGQADRKRINLDDRMKWIIGARNFDAPQAS